MTVAARWAVWMADLDPAEGSEQAGRRPVMVVSNDAFNEVMPVVTVLPLTSLKPGRRVYPSEVLLKKGEAGLKADSLVLAHQVRTISATRMRNPIGVLTDRGKQEQIAGAVRLHLDL